MDTDGRPRVFDSTGSSKKVAALKNGKSVCLHIASTCSRWMDGVDSSRGFANSGFKISTQLLHSRMEQSVSCIQ